VTSVELIFLFGGRPDGDHPPDIVPLKTKNNKRRPL